MKENSIEEDIKNAEHFIKSIKTDKEYKEENGWHGYYNKEIVELARMLEHILSEYKKALKENEQLKKENEKLKQEKINNHKMMILAQNEALGYMQGYEDGKNSRISAIASIVENQQYYIIREQIEKYEENIKKLQTENKELKKFITEGTTIKPHSPYENYQLDFLRENFISVQKIKEKMKKDIKAKESIIFGGRRSGKTLEYGKRLGRIEMCKELLNK